MTMYLKLVKFERRLVERRIASDRKPGLRFDRSDAEFTPKSIALDHFTPNCTDIDSSIRSDNDVAYLANEATGAHVSTRGYNVLTKERYDALKSRTESILAKTTMPENIDRDDVQNFHDVIVKIADGFDWENQVMAVILT